MIEFIKHALGLCGEGHPSILYSAPFFIVVYNYCWCWLKGKFNKEHVCTHGKENNL